MLKVIFAAKRVLWSFCGAKHAFADQLFAPTSALDPRSRLAFTRGRARTRRGASPWSCAVSFR